MKKKETLETVMKRTMLEKMEAFVPEMYWDHQWLVMWGGACTERWVGSNDKKG